MVQSYQRRSGRQVRLDTFGHTPLDDIDFDRVRSGLMDNVAMAMAFDGDYDDAFSAGLPDDDPVGEYYLVPLDSDRSKREFESEADEHYSAKLRREERDWLAWQKGAIVTEETGTGWVGVEFYDSKGELARAWEETVKAGKEITRELEEEAREYVEA